MLKRLVLTLSVVLAACGGDNAFTGPGPLPAGETGSSVAGTYTLASVNGQLPYVFFQNTDGRAEFTGGTMVMRADGSYTETLNLRAVFTNGTPSQTDVAVENGTFSVVGTQVTFTVPPANGDGGFSYTGAVNGKNLTYLYQGIAFNYTRP